MFGCPYMWYMIFIAVGIILLIHLLLPSISYKSKPPIKTLIVLGSGGHTKEALSLTEALDPNIYSPRIYVASNNDALSITKAVQFEQDRNRADYEIMKIFRAREVGQSWITSVFTTAISLFHAIHIIFTTHPKLVLCNGPGVCVPICIVAFIAKKFCMYQTKIVFVESICRIKSLSFSGVILRHFVDGFFVQWENQAKTYSGTKFIGRLS